MGNIGYEKVSDYTALGVSVNIAARLCGKAGPGQILISESTHRAIGRRFKTRRLDPVEVKGIRHPLEVHEVLT